MADKTINELTAATTVTDDDLLVLQQNGQAKKLTGSALGDYVYAAAAEKIAEVNQIVTDAQSSINTLDTQKNEIAQSVASMANLGTDTTLSTAGMAADAKTTGDEISDLKSALNRPSTEANFNSLALLNAAEIPEGLIKSLTNPLEGSVVSGKAWRITKTTTDGNAYKYTDYTFPASYQYGLFVITGHSWSNVYPLVSFYDSSDNLLSCIGERNNRDYANYVVTIPKGAVRAVVTEKQRARLLSMGSEQI